MDIIETTQFLIINGYSSSQGIHDQQILVYDDKENQIISDINLQEKILDLKIRN